MAAAVATFAGSATPRASVEDCAPNCSRRTTAISGVSREPTILYWSMFALAQSRNQLYRELQPARAQPAGGDT
jgi:hypothetical protein